MDSFFEIAHPEAVGISSKRLHNFFDCLDESNLPLHSVLVIRYGKLVTETYYAPYTKDTLHRMFSVTKSFTALAIGLLEAEGKLALSDKIIDHFPEKLPANGVHPYIEKITIRDMLMMSTAHAGTTYKRDLQKDWVESFFTTEPSHLPGTVFSYDTSSSHTLAGLVEKLAGKSLLDYLRDKFLNEIGFSQEAYGIKDPFGVTQGGSGLMAKPLDLAKVAWVVLREGNYRGKQYLPKEFLKDAVSKQIDNYVRGDSNSDQKQGYGYQMWRVRNNGYSMLGMGGQLAVCFPDQDLLLVTTGDTQAFPGGVKTILESFYQEILEPLAAQPLPENPEELASLNKRLANNAIQPITGIQRDNSATQRIDGEYILAENSMGFQKVRLELVANKGCLHFTNHNGDQKLNFGLEEIIVSEFPHYQHRCATSAAWVSENDLVIVSHIIDQEIGSITIQLAFRDDSITMVMKKVIETGYREFAGFVSGTRSLKD